MKTDSNYFHKRRIKGGNKICGLAICIQRTIYQTKPNYILSRSQWSTGFIYKSNHCLICLVSYLSVSVFLGWLSFNVWASLQINSIGNKMSNNKTFWFGSESSQVKSSRTEKRYQRTQETSVPDQQRSPTSSGYISWQSVLRTGCTHCLPRSKHHHRIFIIPFHHFLHLWVPYTSNDTQDTTQSCYRKQAQTQEMALCSFNKNIPKSKPSIQCDGCQNWKHLSCIKYQHHQHKIHNQPLQQLHKQPTI